MLSNVVSVPSHLNMGRLAITSRWSISPRALFEGFPSKIVGPHPQSGSMLACVLVVLGKMALVLNNDILAGDDMKPLTIPAKIHTPIVTVISNLMFGIRLQLVKDEVISIL